MIVLQSVALIVLGLIGLFAAIFATCLILHEIYVRIELGHFPIPIWHPAIALIVALAIAVGCGFGIDAILR